MDAIGRTRQATKDRLAEIKKEGTKLQRERQERRKVEAENRKLKKEIAELKDMQLLWGALE